jgi:hypothetical protein
VEDSRHLQVDVALRAGLHVCEHTQAVTDVLLTNLVSLVAVCKGRELDRVIDFEHSVPSS